MSWTIDEDAVNQRCCVLGPPVDQRMTRDPAPCLLLPEVAKYVNHPVRRIHENRKLHLLRIILCEVWSAELIEHVFDFFSLAKKLSLRDASVQGPQKRSVGETATWTGVGTLTGNRRSPSLS